MKPTPFTVSSIVPGRLDVGRVFEGYKIVEILGSGAKRIAVTVRRLADEGSTGEPEFLLH
jgi:hypothetical protein